MRELVYNELWWNGPESTDQSGNNIIEGLAMPEECATEMKAKNLVTHNLLNPTASPSVDLQQVIVCEDYDNLTRLLHVTAYVLRFIRLLKDKDKDRSTPSHQLLTLEEITEAERLWIIQSQLQLASDGHFDEWRKQFDLFRDEKEILRCGGRLTNSDLQYSTKHPIFLSKQTHLAMLIARKAHEKVLRNGVKDTLTEIRTKYWIVKRRSLVRSVIHQCVVCRRYEGKPTITQPLHHCQNFE